MSALEIYDPLLDGLADLVGDFDAAKLNSTEDWIRQQWTRYADALQFRDGLDRLLKGRRRSRVLMNETGLRAFYAFLTRSQRGALQPAQARIRHMSLTAMRRITPSNLWFTNIDSRRLPESGCFDTGEEGAPPPQTLEGFLRMAPAPAVMPRARAFDVSVSASYFADRDPRNVTACAYPVRLSLGTFPVVYGDNLADPVGLHWYSHKQHKPALEAMRICSRFWSQAGNLAQDARVVIDQYKHFRLATARVFNRKMPGARDARTGWVTPLDRRKRIAAPRGPIAVDAYNFVLLQFASFFAARRSYLRAPTALSPEAVRAAQANPDPILREQLGMTKRAV